MYNIPVTPTGTGCMYASRIYAWTPSKGLPELLADIDAEHRTPVTSTLHSVGPYSLNSLTSGRRSSQLAIKEEGIASPITTISFTVGTIRGSIMAKNEGVKLR
jgi:hypothetical protein